MFTRDRLRAWLDHPWVEMLLFVIGILTAWFVVGIFVIIAAFVYFIYRTIKGLILAVDSKPYV